MRAGIELLPLLDSDRFSDTCIGVKDHHNIAAILRLPKKPDASFERRLLAFKIAAFLQIPALLLCRGESSRRRPSA